ncbi:MAG: hypothetical protein H8E16_12905 [Flavobacteriales bacterium]|nr:hypothetical protein [Flavobacteriales bacterium]
MKHIKEYSEFKKSLITEKLARGLKPLLKIGSTITKKAGEDALLDLSDKFDRIDDEYAGTIASWLDMAIELMQDGYAGDATKKLKQFNKACKDVLAGKEIGSAFENVNEATYNSKNHIGSTSDGQGSNAEIYKKGKGYYVVVSGEADYDFDAKNDKELLKKLKDNEFDSTDILEVNEGKFDDIGDLVKSLHFEIDPKVAKEKKIELGKRQGEYSLRKQIEGGEYSLRRFRKEIKYDKTGKDLGIFRPGSYMAATSTVGDGPHGKAVAKIKWNQKKYDQWLEDVASNDGWKNAFDMAQNAKQEPGLISWVKKTFRVPDPMQRIQWDIESFAESVDESAMSELDILAKEAKDFKAFTKEVFKEFKNLPKKADTLKWLEELYNDAINEAEKAEGDRSKLSADIEKALKDKATESGVPIGLLRLVMRRGLDAWNSSHRAGVPQVAWGYARVNAFLEKGKGTWGKADADIAKEVRDEGKAGKLPIKNPSEFTKKEREA